MTNTKSAIQWTDATWNPVTGCSRVSDGCRYCYAETISHRFKHTTKTWSFINAAENVVLHPERLDAPLSWRKPQRVFVNSMSDLWHERVPDEFITRIFGVMAATPQHTYQILTKRPERMRDWLRGVDQTAIKVAGMEALGGLPWRQRDRLHAQLARIWQWPLPNVWLGVSVEDQRAADERIPLLLQTPAAVRFLSCEPLLGPVDLTQWIGQRDDEYSASRERCLSSSGVGRTHGFTRRDDMASSRETRRSRATDNSHYFLPTSTSGEDGFDRLPASESDVQRQASERASASFGLASRPWAYSRGHDDQPHQREQTGQSARESGASDTFGADLSCASSAETWTPLADGRVERHGEVDLGSGEGNPRQASDGRATEIHRDGLRRDGSSHLESGAQTALDGLSWIIVGGESGPHARPMELGWAQSLVEQCRAAEVAPFVKQLGQVWAREHGCKERHAGDPEEWPVELRVREFPMVTTVEMAR